MGCERYRVVLTSDAEQDLDGVLSYLVYRKRNREAAISLLEDFQETIESLTRSAGSLKLDDDPNLARREYRRIHLSRHRYFMLYRVDDDVAVVDRIFHDLQDYRSRM